jgi:three-Cys-motif partner protein
MQVSVPSGYKDREQAFIKHLLLEQYLERLFRIVGYSTDRLSVSELAYIDCFAGPWQDDSDNLETTSIAISLRIMEQCRTDLAARGRYLKFRALFLEKDRTAAKRLQEYLSTRSVAGVTADAICGDFVDLRERVLAWCGDTAFAFFFVDPEG